MLKASTDDEEEDALFSVLGRDLAIKILVRLPAKPLFRFKCVSKRWLGLISDPFLPTVYNANNSVTTSSTGFFLQFKCIGVDDSDILWEQIHFCPFVKTTTAFEPEDNNSVVLHNSSLSFLGLTRTVLLSSSMGLLLCSDCRFYQKHYYVCNPITKQRVTLPEPSHSCYYIVSPHLHCYNDDDTGSAVPNKFVVVLFIASGTLRSKDVLEVETFSSETGSWKLSRIACPPSLSNIIIVCQGIFDWTTYWVYCAGGRIGSYDLKKETLKVLPLLPGSDNPCAGCVSSNDGLLHYAQSNNTSLCIWELLTKRGVNSNESDREWSLKYTISLQGLLDDHPNIIQRTVNCPSHVFSRVHKLLFEPLAFHPSNPDIVLLNLPGIVVSCQLDKRKLELILPYSYVKESRLSYSQIFPYTPTLWPVAIPPIRSKIASASLSL